MAAVGQHRHRPDLLPGLGIEAGAVQQENRLIALMALDDVMDPAAPGLDPAGLVLDHILPARGFAGDPPSSSTPCSSNQRIRPTSRAASASASVSALSSSTWVPPSCSARATKPKSSCTPISM